MESPVSQCKETTLSARCLCTAAFGRFYAVSLLGADLAPCRD